MKKTIMLLLAFPIILIFACSSAAKEEVVSVRDLLLNGVWVQNLEYEDLDLDGTFVLFNDVCDQDNPWEFRTDGTLKQTLGPVLCDPDDDPNLTIQIDWELRDNDQELVLLFFADEIRFHIKSINTKELVLSQIEAGNPTGVYTQEVVLKR